MKKILALIFCIVSFSVHAKTPFSYFKGLHTDIFPIPVFESRPDEGLTYGLMPVMVMSDDTGAIKSILGAIGQYNSVTKAGGALIGYLYPESDQEIEFYAEFAQDYARELTFHYFNSTLNDKWYLDLGGSYTRSPFGFFFGFGPNIDENDKSNYISDTIHVDLTGGYEILKNIHANLTLRIDNTDLMDRAIDDNPATLTKYAALNEVTDALTFIWEPSLVFDNRPDREYSKKGSYAQLAYKTSQKALGSDHSFNGWNLEVIHLLPVIKDRMTSVFRLNVEQLVGDIIPFYQQASLGGPNEFRAFIPQRFVDKSKIVFQTEERIKLFKATLFGNSFETYLDPFFELGHVFSSFNSVGFQKWQPTGGLGFRLFVPPNVIGRLDIAVGTDGLEMYTALGYPF